MEFCRFNGINKEELTTIIPYLQIAYFQVGDYVFKTGESATNFYCILRGKISILLPEIRTKNVKNEKQTVNEFKSIHNTYVNNFIDIKDKNEMKLAELKTPKYNTNICKYEFLIKLNCFNKKYIYKNNHFSYDS